MKEIWAQIPDLPIGYEISSRGRGRINYGDRYEYMYIGTTNNYKTIQACGKQLKVHRLVAAAFLPNPEGKQEVNHKDGNKANNYVENLEWITASENIQHAYRTGLMKGKPVIELTSGLQFATVYSAAVVFRIPTDVVQYSANNSVSCYGLKFIWADENVNLLNCIYISRQDVILDGLKNETISGIDNFIKHSTSDFSK